MSDQYRVTFNSRACYELQTKFPGFDPVPFYAAIAELLKENIPKLVPPDQQQQMIVVEKTIRDVITQQFAENAKQLGDPDSKIENLFNKGLVNVITAKDNVIEPQIQQLCANVNNLQSCVNTIQTEINNTKVMKAGAQSRGQQGELEWYDLLLKSFPFAEVTHVGKTQEHCDIEFNRVDKPRIFVEIKNYTNNVPTIEVTKFIHDITKHKCCGIMIAQNSGIVGKNHMHIELNGNNVVVYLAYAETNVEHFKHALTVIDCLYGKLNAGDGEVVDIDMELITQLNREYAEYNDQVSLLLLSAKSSIETYNSLIEITKKDMQLMRKLKLPAAEEMLSRFFAINKKQMKDTYTSVQCEFCNIIYEKQQQLNAHISLCKANPAYIGSTVAETGSTKPLSAYKIKKAAAAQAALAAASSTTVPAIIVEAVVVEQIPK